MVKVQYGIWGVSRDHPEGMWHLDSIGHIIQTDLLGVAMAYAKVIKSQGQKAEVKIIGFDGEPKDT